MGIVTQYKTHVGKEDMEIQTNKVTTPETFVRYTTTGGMISLTKIPDIWEGTGCINTGKVLVRAADDPDTILHSFGGTS